ncbi:MAG: hypothetical protein ACJAWL_002367 [Motiliproteus sp.]|jgi:hypothetical protein
MSHKDEQVMQHNIQPTLTPRFLTPRFRQPQVLIACAVITLCLWGLYQALRMGMADVVAYKARYPLKTWEQAARLPTMAEADDALEKASGALSWAPKNPEYLDLRAHLLTYKSLLPVNNETQAEHSVRVEPLTREALALYQQSTGLRPKWPYSWSRLALVKSYLGEFDQVFTAAVAKAVKYGPWEPGVHKTLLEAGLSGWFELDADTRRALGSTASRGLRLDSRGITAIVQRHQKRDQLCGYLPNDRYSKALCGW